MTTLALFSDRWNTCRGIRCKYRCIITSCCLEKPALKSSRCCLFLRKCTLLSRNGVNKADSSSYLSLLAKTAAFCRMDSLSRNALPRAGAVKFLTSKSMSSFSDSRNTPKTRKLSSSMIKGFVLGMALVLLVGVGAGILSLLVSLRLLLLLLAEITWQNEPCG